MPREARLPLFLVRRVELPADCCLISGQELACDAGTHLRSRAAPLLPLLSARRVCMSLRLRGDDADRMFLSLFSRILLPRKEGRKEGRKDSRSPVIGVHFPDQESCRCCSRGTGGEEARGGMR